MTSKEFIAKLKDIAAIRTVYMWGMFGGPVTEARIREKVKQYPRYYSATKQAKLRGMIGKGVYAFDCVGLIKGVLWGWRGDPNPLGHGGARYEDRAGPTDIDANQMIARCKDVSTDFSRIVPGCAVWMQGHIGIYIGDGRVIEATPAWQDGVQVSACLNIGPIAGLQKRRWTKHGKLPWVEYVQEPVSKGVETAINYQGKKYPAKIVGDQTRLTLRTLVDMLGPDATIPIRAFAEAMGLAVAWSATTKETTLKKK